MSISLCMIAKDEENNIGNAIDSVKGLVDEIIVVDTGSSDGTRKAASAKGAKVVDYRWNDDFSAARNEGLKHATKEWVMVLDCDEIIAKEDLPKIKELTETGSVDGYFFLQFNYTNNRLIAGFKSAAGNPYSNGFAGRYTSAIVRLFRNGKGYEFRGRLHELVEHSIREKKGRLEVAQVVIHHYGNADSESVKKKRIFYYALAKKKAGEQKDAQSYYELGMLEKEQGNPQEAEDALKSAIAANPQHALSHFELGILKKKQKQYPGAIGWVTKSLESKPTASAFLERGVCHLQEGNLKKAHANFIKAAMLDANNPSIYNNLGIVQERNGQFLEAAKMYELAAKLNPNHPPYAVNLGNALAKFGEFGKAADAYRKALSLGHPKKDELEKAIADVEGREKQRVTVGYSVEMGDTPEKQEKQNQQKS